MGVNWQLQLKQMTCSYTYYITNFTYTDLAIFPVYDHGGKSRQCSRAVSQAKETLPCAAFVGRKTRNFPGRETEIVFPMEKIIKN